MRARLNGNGDYASSGNEGKAMVTWARGEHSNSGLLLVSTNSLPPQAGGFF